MLHGRVEAGSSAGYCYLKHGSAVKMFEGPASAAPIILQTLWRHLAALEPG